MELPPGQSNAEHDIIWRSPLSMEIHGIFPHMHTLGTSLTVQSHNTVTEQDQCVIDLPRWDFEWQQFFFYSENSGPITVNTGDTINVTCRYDTSGRQETVRWGDGTRDEMCVSFLYVTQQ
jgi:hypothetical protein